MNVHLVVLSGGRWQGRSIPLSQVPYFIGRDPLCDLRPTSLFVSKRHCALLEREGTLWVQDLGSANGTFVNEERVQGEMQLTDGDRLKIGPLHLRIVLHSKFEQVTSPVVVSARMAENQVVPTGSTKINKPPDSRAVR
jgi:pSer/pThr/pTyr-binding forkhead associated (FHA) protein